MEKVPSRGLNGLSATKKDCIIIAHLTHDVRQRIRRKRFAGIGPHHATGKSASSLQNDLGIGRARAELSPASRIVIVLDRQRAQFVLKAGDQKAAVSPGIGGFHPLVHVARDARAFDGLTFVSTTCPEIAIPSFSP